MKAIVTPVGEIMWAFVGKGHHSNDNMDKDAEPKWVKRVSLHLKTESKECKQLTGIINEYWENYKTEAGLKKTTKPASVGYKVVLDENDEPTDVTEFSFKTSAFYNNKEVIIPIYNAKGIKTDLGDSKIGNGSRGAIHFTIGSYNVHSKHGISLYLAAVQLTKFVEYAPVEIEATELDDSAAGDDIFTGDVDILEDDDGTDKF